jgi:hypothetical protein
MPSISRLGLIALVFLVVSALKCAPEQRSLEQLVGVWSAEFSRSTSRVYGTVTFDSVATMPRGEVRLVGTLQLDSSNGADSDLVVALFGHPDGCLQPSNAIHALKRDADAVEILFTPSAADCGLFGRVSASTFNGEWQEPSFVGARSQGELRMQRRGRK